MHLFKLVFSFSLDKYPEVELLDLYGSSTLNSLKNYYIVLHISFQKLSSNIFFLPPFRSHPKMRFLPSGSKIGPSTKDGGTCRCPQAPFGAASNCVIKETGSPDRIGKSLKFLVHRQ